MAPAFFDDIEKESLAEKTQKKPFYLKPIYWLAFVLSLLWLWASIDYMAGVEWWATRYRLTPAEFVGTVASQLLPFALIWFVIAWIERRGQLEEETKTLRNYMNQLMYPTEEGAVYTQSLTNALRNQIKEFKVVFEQVAGQTKTVREEMKRWIKDLAIVIDHVDTKTLGAMKEMSGHVKEIISSTEQANQSTINITQNFADRTEVLTATTEKVVKVMEGLCLTLEGNISHIDSATDGLKDAADKTEQILKISENSTLSFNQHMDRLESLLNRYETQTNEFNEHIFNNAEKILTVLKTQGSLLDQEVEKTLHKMAQAQAKVSDEAAELSSVCDSTLTHLDELGTQLAVQTDNLNQVLTETDERVRKLGTMAIEEQTKQLVDVSNKTQQVIDRLKADLTAVSTDRFMKDARIILEHLATFSIDIVHVFTPKAEEEQWKKYYAGDNSAFMRYLITALPKEKADGFKKVYQENSTLRVAVMRYMSEFDALAVKAKANEKKDVLLPVLIGSDAGRLYMILKQVLGKSTKDGV